jgi:CHASE2 domain-containing sensor protein
MKIIVPLIAFLIIGGCRPAAPPIVLVNVGHHDRTAIAQCLQIINESNPKVIAVDLTFRGSKGTEVDDKLARSLAQCKNLVIPSELCYEGDSMYVKARSDLQFCPIHAKSGFVNVLQDADSVSSVRRFLIRQEVAHQEGKHIEYHFAVMTAFAFDSTGASRFLDNSVVMTAINYKKGHRVFETIHLENVIAKQFTNNFFRGKLVMVGFQGPGLEDKFFTPLNKGSSEPDMYGVEYLANIVSQILEFNQ